MPLPSALDDLATHDPRAFGEDEWLFLFELLLGRLGAATGAAIESGEHWLELGATQASASLCARLRADGALFGTASDGWEAALSVTGGADGTYADVVAFPFLCGSVVTRDGRMADLDAPRDVDERWLAYVGGRWVDRGWQSPAGAGEWAHVLAPGGAFVRSLACTAVATTVPARAPVVVMVDDAGDGERALGEAASFSIHRLARDGVELVRAPAATALARAGSARRAACEHATLPAALPLDALAIPGGWAPGRYEVELRVDLARTEATRASRLTEAVALEIVALGG